MRARSVTLEGDVYDPAGTLTGGSRPASGNLLLELQKLNDAKSELKGRKDALKVSLFSLTD